jgi:hypothetical protein
MKKGRNKEGREGRRKEGREGGREGKVCKGLQENNIKRTDMKPGMF